MALQVTEVSPGPLVECTATRETNRRHEFVSRISRPSVFISDRDGFFYILLPWLLCLVFQKCSHLKCQLLRLFGTHMFIWTHTRSFSLKFLSPMVQAVPVMASPLPVSFILVFLLLAQSPACQAGDCKGHRQVLRGPPGYVTDGPGNYSVNGNCEWLIKGIVTKLRCWYWNESLRLITLIFTTCFISSSSQQQPSHCLEFHLHGHRVHLWLPVCLWWWLLPEPSPRQSEWKHSASAHWSQVWQGNQLWYGWLVAQTL